MPSGDPQFYPLTPVTRNDWPRVVAMNGSDEIQCSTTLTGTNSDGLGHPTGEFCQFTAPATPTLHIAVADNLSWHYRIRMDNIEPFLSHSAETWFDPRDYTHPYLTQFLVPRD